MSYEFSKLRIAFVTTLPSSELFIEVTTSLMLLSLLVGLARGSILLSVRICLVS
jgi:hypothetical protein